MSSDKLFEFTDKQRELLAACSHLQAMTAIYRARMDMSPVEAYRAAGGKSSKAAEAAAAADVMSKPAARAFYDSLIESVAAEAILTREEALIRLSRAARVVVTDVFDIVDVEIGRDADGEPIYETVWRIKDGRTMSREAKAAIKYVKYGKYGLEVGMHDPLIATKQVAELQGWEAPKKIEAETKVAVIIRGDDAEL